MKKVTWIPLVLIGAGLLLAFLGFAGGGLRGAWADRDGWHLAGAERGRLVEVDESYDEEDVRHIDLRAGYIGQVVLKEGKGDEFSVRGANYERYGGLEVDLDNDGTLRVSTADVRERENGKWFHFGIDIDTDYIFSGRNDDGTYIEITWPKGAALGEVGADIDASDLRISGLDCDTLTASNSLGLIETKTLNCGTLTINAAAGNLELSDADVAGETVVENNFGNVLISGLKADSLSVSLDAGDLELKNVDADTLKADNNFGRIKANGAKADLLVLKLDSGDLSAADISAGGMDVSNSFGDISFERLVFTGLCEIDSDAGKVELGLSMAEDSFSYELETDAGSVRVGDRKAGGKGVGGAESVRVPGKAAKLEVDSSMGDIKVKFEKEK